MLPTIPSGNVTSGLATGYDVANSCRWNDDDKPRLYKSNGTPTSRRKFTYSVWLKRSSLDEEADLHMMFVIQGNSNRFYVAFFGDKLRVNGTKSGDGTTALDIKTNRMFRDFSAWYHICVAVDTEQGTAANRVKIYVNGTLETSFANASYPDEDEDLAVNESNVEIGNHIDYDNQHYDGYMAEVVFIDGTQEAVTSFGEFDEDSPTIWKPIDVSGLTFGTNGFYLDFEDSSNLGNDANGGTDFTQDDIVAADQATDTPTNNFCTMNPLVPTTNVAFSEGNCKWVSDGSDTYGGGIGTFGLTAGKWWFEVKISSLVANHNHGAISELTAELYQNAAALQNDTGVTCWRNDDGGELVLDGTATTNDYGLFTDGQIMGIALDIDNYNISIYRNGSALASDVNMSSTRGTIFPFINTGISTTAEVNFGGCSAFTVSSGNADANGYGNFEYAVPSGYLALCTKNLGSDGG